MTHEPRLIEPGEAEATMDIVAAVFGAGPVAPDDYRAEIRELLEPDRSLPLLAPMSEANSASSHATARA